MSSKQIVKEEFPRAFQELARECTYHPNLRINPSKDFHLNLAAIAAYCEVILDGIYTYEDQIQIAERLTEKLYNARMKGRN